jgi:hypothetical protein
VIVFAPQLSGVDSGQANFRPRSSQASGFHQVASSGMGVFFDVIGLNIVHAPGVFFANCSTFD